MSLLNGISGVLLRCCLALCGAGGRVDEAVVGGGELMTSVTAEMHLIVLDAQCLFL